MWVGNMMVNMSEYVSIVMMIVSLLLISIFGVYVIVLLGFVSR